MYISVNDLIAPLGYFTEEELSMYSSKVGEAITLNTDRIESIITQRSYEIDTYLRGRYSLPIPLDNVSLLKDICKNLVSYDLVVNRLGSKITELQKNWETRAYGLLEKVVKGEITIIENNEADARYSYSKRTTLLDTSKF